MSGDRDNFSSKTKKVLAERSAWRCGFPGCTASTIGPSEADEAKSITLGEAAHITAAAPKGPRYDDRLSEDERSDGANGIWMCRPHAKLVDADEDMYSAETLRLWKAGAEGLAAQELKSGGRAAAVTPSTLVMLGFNHVIHAHWIRGGGGEWHFDCLGFVRGTEQSLIDEVEHYGNIREVDRFVVVESQGDGRMLSSLPQWERHSGVHRLILPVASRAPRTDPSLLGADIALGGDGDLSIKDGDFALVSGIDNAIQKLSTIMGTMLGEWVMKVGLGSLCALYFHKYGGDLPLLGRLFRLEFARLATIPFAPSTPEPSLNFVWRVDEVRVVSLELKGRRLSVTVTLEWTSGARWTGKIPIYIHEPDRLKKLPEWIVVD